MRAKILENRFIRENANPWGGLSALNKMGTTHPGRRFALPWADMGRPFRALWGLAAIVYGPIPGRF
jgi:hypothetical protein